MVEFIHKIQLTPKVIETPPKLSVAIFKDKKRKKTKLKIKQMIQNLPPFLQKNLHEEEWWVWKHSLEYEKGNMYYLVKLQVSGSRITNKEDTHCSLFL